MLAQGQIGGGFGGGIKSIQRGTIALAGVTTNTATITAVDPTNSLLHWLGENSNDAAVNTTEREYVGLTFTNATTITATRANATNTATVSFEVIEFYPGVLKSVQRGTIAGQTTATITSVDTTKAMLELMGRTGDAANFTGTISVARVALTNATTITSTVTGATGIVQYWQVVEFY